VKDEDGNLFDIPLAGPQDLLEKFIEGKPIQVKLGPPKPPDEPGQSADPVYGEKNASASDAGSQQQDVSRQEMEKEPPPEYPARALDIKISVAQTSLDEYALRLEVDPDIPEGDSHYYFINRADEVWVTCETTVGDADLHLHERCSDGSWLLRASSVKPGTEMDSVSAIQQETGYWRIRVYGYIASTFSLSGTFNVL
jgi:hypothetical protein